MLYDPSLGAGVVDALDRLQLFHVFSSIVVQHRARRPDHLDRRVHHRPHAAAVAPVRRHPGRPARPLLRPQAARPGADAGMQPPTPPPACSAATGSTCGARSRTARRYLYGDRHRWTKMATLLTHTGLVLFLVAAAMTSRLGDEQGLVVAEGESLTVQPIGTPGPAARPQPGLRGAGVRDRQAHGLHDPPRGVPGRVADRRQDDPRQRPAGGGRLHVPPERVRARAGRGDPRRGRQAAVDGADPDDRRGRGLPVRGVRRARPRRGPAAAPPAGGRRRRRAARPAVPPARR